MPELSEATISVIGSVLVALITGLLALKAGSKGAARSEEAGQSARLLQAQEQIFKNFRKEIARKDKEIQRDDEEIARLQGLVDQLRDRNENLAEDLRIVVDLVKREVKESADQDPPDK